MIHLADETKEAIGMLLCLAAMVTGPAIGFHFLHKIEQERQRKASPQRNR